MKKKTLQLSKKLFLSKDTITPFTKMKVIGGATIGAWCASMVNPTQCQTDCITYCPNGLRCN